jgi:HupE / UreJ protein
MHWLSRLFALFSTLLFVASVSAHKASDAYLVFDDFAKNGTAGERSLSAKFSMALRDIDVGNEVLDANDDRQINWGEIRQALPQLQTWISEGVHLDCAGVALALPWVFDTLVERSDGIYLQFAAATECDPKVGLKLRYTLLKDLDATHRLLIGGVLQGNPIASVHAPQSVAIVLRAIPVGGSTETSWSGVSAFAQFFPEGIHHLATGYDHLAFLLALILPLSWHVKEKRLGIGALIRTITAFTIGHSTTLVLATLGFVVAPRWVEPAIAISIGVSAFLNLYPVRWLRADMLALLFGLIHGLGFSTLMREARVSTELLPWALAGFNFGVEAGQLMAVGLWIGFYLLVLHRRAYQPQAVKFGSWLLLALAAFWTVQRVSS